VTPAFYNRTADGYTPQPYVTGPWADGLSHAGPPAALLLNEVAKGVDGMAIARATFEIPGPIPIVPYTVSVGELRGGKKIRLLQVELRTEADDTAMSALIWCIRKADIGLAKNDPYSFSFSDPTNLPSAAIPIREGIDYFDGGDMRTAVGTPFRGGPSTVVVRQTIPLIAGEEEHPYAKCGMFGDLANGTASILPFGEMLAINIDLTLYLSRAPESDWIALKSTTISHGLGLGMTDSLVYDASGFVGKANQSVFFDHF
jgi:hypothetical protein